MKYSVHFIHIGNPTRDTYALPKLNDLVSHFKADRLHGHAFEGSGPNNDTSILVVLLRDLALFFLEQRFRRLVLGKPSRSPFNTLIAFKNHAKHYLFSTELRQKRKRQCSIERLNLDQHLRALGAFLDSDCSYGLFFEDDIVFKERSITSLKAAFSDRVFCADYIDLAGGIDIRLEAVGGGPSSVHRLVVDDINEIVGMRFERVFTNTSCGYALSRRLAAKMYEFIASAPLLRLIYPVDWLYNFVFMGEGFSGGNFSCIHFRPTPFLHGSKCSYDNPWRA